MKITAKGHLLFAGSCSRAIQAGVVALTDPTVLGEEADQANPTSQTAVDSANQDFACSQVSQVYRFSQVIIVTAHVAVQVRHGVHERA